MSLSLRLAGVTAFLVASVSANAAAQASSTYAIQGARVVTVSGAPLSSGTVIVRDGMIAAVGANPTIPPDAEIIDGAGLIVYPGLIDMGSTQGVVVATREPADPETRRDLERWKHETIVRPHLFAAGHFEPDARDLAPLARTGITTILARLPGEVITGQSALVNVAVPDEAPQIGDITARRRGRATIRTPVALHVGFPARPAGNNAYPNSLMGVIAFVRQTFLDAQHYRLTKAHLAQSPPGDGVSRLSHDERLDALGPALAGELRVAFDAQLAHEVLRALRLADELGLTPIISGGLEADRVVDELKAASVPVIVSLNYPTKPESLAPDADEPLRVLRLRSNAPRVPGVLERAGVLFAFESRGLDDPKDFLANAARAVEGGLSADAAVRALTIDAARIAGAEGLVGSIEAGKIANLIVTDRDLFDPEMTIAHVFVDGQQIDLDADDESTP